MVEFHQRRRKLEPSRSLPMSALNQRERSALPTAAYKETARTPNPYQRPRSDKVTRRTPARAFSANNNNNNNDNNRSMSPRRVKSHHHDTSERSTSPGKYHPSHHAASTMTSKLCPTSCTSSMECFIPPPSSSSSSLSSTPTRNNRFFIVKASLRAITFLLLGFGGGMVYNAYHGYPNNKNHSKFDFWHQLPFLFVSTSNYSAEQQVHHHIPSSLLNEKLVEKLAHDNALQEQEIVALRQQVEAARQKSAAREREEMANATPSSNSDRRRQEANNSLPRDTPAPRIINGGLRAVKRLSWDPEGHVQEHPIDQGETPVRFDNNNDEESQQQQLLLQAAQIENGNQQKNSHPHDDHEMNRDDFEGEHEAHLQYHQQPEQQQQREHDEMAHRQQLHQQRMDQMQQRYHSSPQQEQQPQQYPITEHQVHHHQTIQPQHNEQDTTAFEEEHDRIGQELWQFYSDHSENSKDGKEKMMNNDSNDHKVAESHDPQDQPHNIVVGSMEGQQH